MPSRKQGGIREEAGIPPHLEKDGYLSETARCVSEIAQKSQKGGEEGYSFTPGGSASQEREGKYIANLRCRYQRPDPTLDVRNLDETVTKEKVVAVLCIAVGMPDLGDQCRL